MFTAETFEFLRDLRANNRKDWFDQQRGRYERCAKAPLLQFIQAVAPHLGQLSRHYAANEASVFRLHRDVRFSHDKSPYKTHLAAQFRHAMVGGPLRESVHAPGFYFHLAPDGFGEMEGVFGGFGMWQPPADVLQAVRQRIVDEPEEWQAAVKGLRLTGQSLKRPPQGFDADHPLIADLKRKDFIAVEHFTEADALRPDFAELFGQAMQRGAGLQRFLCAAVRLPF